ADSPTCMHSSKPCHHRVGSSANARSTVAVCREALRLRVTHEVYIARVIETSPPGQRERAVGCQQPAARSVGCFTPTRLKRDASAANANDAGANPLLERL